MTTNTTLVTVVLLLALISSAGQQLKKPLTEKSYVQVTKYDPRRNAVSDLAAATAEAERTHRNVLVEVGGDWCSWCHTLDEFFKANPELMKLRDQNFVTLKVNYSEENQNQQVLSRYPAISGYPHLFFLDAKGKLLQSQDTSALESGSTYSVERMTNVLKNWSPNRQAQP